ncbi:29301_t:CDS:2, partial [Gigaspora margarita]
MSNEDANISLNNELNIDKSQKRNTQNATNISPREPTSHSPSDIISNNSHDRLVGGANVSLTQVSTVHPENLSTAQTLSPSQSSKFDVYPEEYQMAPSSQVLTPPAYNNENEKNRKHNDGNHIVEIPDDAAKAQEIKNTLQTDRQIRMAFIRKVYGLLTLQLLTTVAISLFFMYFQPAKDFVNNYQLLFYISWLAAFVVLIFLFWLRKKHPFNLILLVLFTLCISYGVGSVVSLYSQQIVLEAFLITFGVFIALEAFTLQSKWDFSSWGPFLYATLWVLIFAFIFGWFLPFDRGYNIVISAIAALLFSAYIIYDTYMLTKRVNPDEYVLAAVDLYLD